MPGTRGRAASLVGSTRASGKDRIAPQARVRELALGIAPQVLLAQPEPGFRKPPEADRVPGTRQINGITG